MKCEMTEHEMDDEETHCPFDDSKAGEENNSSLCHCGRTKPEDMNECLNCEEMRFEAWMEHKNDGGQKK